jgi:hypothetical protein
MIGDLTLGEVACLGLSRAELEAMIAAGKIEALFECPARD